MFVKALRRSYFLFLYLLPISLYFSFYPVISLGKHATMNLELSLPLINLALFDVVAFVNMIILWYQTRKNSGLSSGQNCATSSKLPGHHFPGISDRRIFWFSLLPFYATISVFWSNNPFRTCLTAAILWALYFAIFAILYLTPVIGIKKPHSKVLESLPLLPQRLFLVFMISSVLVCLFCWYQGIVDVLGVSIQDSLMCRGCTYVSFGFPHPSGFAIEPQFMGNLLLAPTLLTLYLVTFKRSLLGKFYWPVVILCGFFSSTLFFTFSRGAIYAYGVAFFILLFIALVKKTFRPLLVLLPALTFIITLVLQGIFATVSPTSDTFITGTTKAIHHLTLGVIDLRPIAPDDTEPADTTPDSAVGEVDNDSVFEGYVPESTNIRLLLNQLAVKSWVKTPQNLILGVGLGGAGIAINRYFPEHFPSPKEIVQNEFFSLLLELGLIGIILVALSFYLAFFSPIVRRHFWRQPVWQILLPLIVAYLVTLSFFSGLPNALHIYLAPAIIYLCFQLFPPLSKPIKTTAPTSHQSKNTKNIRI